MHNRTHPYILLQISLHILSTYQLFIRKIHNCGSIRLAIPYLTMHYNDVIMGAIASQITCLTLVHSTVYSGADQRKHQSSMSLASVRGIHRRPVNSPHKWPVTRKMFPFDDVIMVLCVQITVSNGTKNNPSWLHHQMETLSGLLAICAGNSQVTGEFPTQRPATRSFDFFSLTYAWTNGWVSNREAGDLRRHWAHYDVTVMDVLARSRQSRDIKIIGRCSDCLKNGSFRYMEGQVQNVLWVLVLEFERIGSLWWGINFTKRINSKAQDCARRCEIYSRISK